MEEGLLPKARSQGRAAKSRNSVWVEPGPKWRERAAALHILVVPLLPLSFPFPSLLGGHFFSKGGK